MDEGTVEGDRRPSLQATCGLSKRWGGSPGSMNVPSNLFERANGRQPELSAWLLAWLMAVCSPLSAREWLVDLPVYSVVPYISLLIIINTCLEKKDLLEGKGGGQGLMDQSIIPCHDMSIITITNISSIENGNQKEFKSWWRACTKFGFNKQIDLYDKFYTWMAKWLTSFLVNPKIGLQEANLY